MRAILLAAGVGRRFKGAWPKPLKRLYGQQTVLGHTVEMLRGLGLDITIVIGHGAKHFLPLFGREVTFVYNPDYATTQWLESAKLAMSLLPAESFILGCADALVTQTTLHHMIATPDSVLLSPILPREEKYEYYRVRIVAGKMGETEPERSSAGAWPARTFGNWGHVGPIARKGLQELKQRDLARCPARPFEGCRVIIGTSYNINTLEDLEVARKSFQGA